MKTNELIKQSVYSLKKIKLLKLVIILSLIYATGLAFADILGVTEKIEYRAPLMVMFAVSNLILLYMINTKSEHSQKIFYAVLVIALFVFTVTMIIYPKSEIRVMWYFFTIMIAYFVGGQRIGNITAIGSAIIIIIINNIFLGFQTSVIAYFMLGILFMSQLSNYIVVILNQNEKDLHQYQHHLEDMIEEGLREIAGLNDEITATQKEVVFTMGSIGESRSKETGNHVKRVAEYSKILALAYGMPIEEAELLHLASPMHDIGKVAIPDSILNKPARFTPDEFEIMKTHTQLGYDMLKYSKRPILNTASIVAYQHHERWDGKGYPQGLKAEKTHIYGRITALADVFDALGSTRCYKDAWEDEKIFKLFKEERGAQFDPKLIDIFFENLDKFLTIRDKFSDK